MLDNTVIELIEKMGIEQPNETIISLAIRQARFEGISDEDILEGKGIWKAIAMTEELYRSIPTDDKSLYSKFLSQVLGKTSSEKELLIRQQVKDIVASALEANKRSWQG